MATRALFGFSIVITTLFGILIPEMVDVTVDDEYGIVPTVLPFTFTVKLPLLSENGSRVVMVMLPIPSVKLGDVIRPFLNVMAVPVIVWSVRESVASHVPPAPLQFLNP